MVLLFFLNFWDNYRIFEFFFSFKFKAGTKTIEASGIRIPNTQSIMRNITNSFMIIKNYKNSKSVYKISKGKQHHSQEKTVQIHWAK